MDNKKNTCDKCHTIRYSENLVWISAEDFKPLEGEKLLNEAFKIIP